MSLMTGAIASFGVRRDSYSPSVRIANRLGRCVVSIFLGVAILGTFLTPRLIAAPASDQRLRYTGINIAGAAFGSKVLPGKHGTHYFYPKAASIDYFASKGMNIIRVPFRWERLQRRIGADLDEDELRLLDGVVDYATSKNIYVLLDPHNYATYFGTVLGTPDLPIERLATFWGLLADHYKKNPKVFFGLMNEPKEIAADTWLSAVNASIAEIRRRGADNTVFVPGVSWTSARNWLKSSADVMRQVVDPKENYVYEVHQYFDQDFRGTRPECRDPTSIRATLTGFTNWAREHHKRGFLGEFAVGPDHNCLDLLDELLKFMEENSDVWVGWTYWAAGPFAKNYFTNLEPSDGADKPQLSILERHTNGGNLAFDRTRK
jgi:endoglucanase